MNLYDNNLHFNFYLPLKIFNNSAFNKKISKWNIGNKKFAYKTSIMYFLIKIKLKWNICNNKFG